MSNTEKKTVLTPVQQGVSPTAKPKPKKRRGRFEGYDKPEMISAVVENKTTVLPVVTVDTKKVVDQG